MKPFIKLEPANFKNIPTQEETQKFESYMKQIEISNQFLGHFRSGIGYFSEEDKDDLAYAFEAALDKWYKKQNGVIYTSATKESVYDADGNVTDSYYTEAESIRSACEKKEKELRSLLADTIRDHLKRTGGNIGHFPYSGERVLMSFEDDILINETVQIKLDPFDIYWPNAYIFAIEETAEYNRERINVKPLATQNERIKKHFTTFGISVAIFLIACFILNTFYQITFYDLITHIRTVSAIVGIVSFIKFSRELIDKYYYHYDSTPKRCDKDGFYPTFVNLGHGPNSKYVTYTKDRFVCEIEELHNYYQFQQIWSNLTGYYISAYNQDKRNNVYKVIEPFVINGKDYIQE